MKKIISLALVICSLMLFAAPAMATASDDVVQPRASLFLDGGMVYDTSVGKHYIHGQAYGASEWKRVTATLYIQNGSGWSYVDSSTNTGTTSTVSTGKHVDISSGYYRVDVNGITGDTNCTTSYYYSI